MPRLYVLGERYGAERELTISAGEQSPRPGVLLVGTLDTKGAEIAFVASELESLGCRAVVLDSGILGEPLWDGATYPRRVVAARGGFSLDELRELDRGEALLRMAEGVKALAVELARAGEIEGAICIAGAGVSLAVPAFQALGHGFPKLLVSPLASGARKFEPFVGTSDIAVMHSVADIIGVNAVTRPIFVQAAGFIFGAIAARRRSHDAEVRLPESILVAAMMNGNTTPALMHVKERLSAVDVDLVAFHANGVGGRAMEELAERGLFRGVLDYTTTELGGHEIGGLMDAGAQRMEVAGRLGLPQVLVPGCLDLITTGTYEETAREWPERPLYRHNASLTLVRLSQKEMAILGRKFAAKANLATGPTAVCIPTQGFSIPNHPAGPFWDPDADAAFIAELKEHIHPSIPVHCVDAHINDLVFADLVADVFLAQLAELKLPLPSDMEVAQ